MSLEKDDAKWLKRGRQRAAVARVLRKPMTATEICAAARAFAGHVQLRDVWFLMRQFQERGLVVCVNPRLVTGRLYSLTEDRAKVPLRMAFGIRMVPAVRRRRLAKILLGRKGEDPAFNATGTGGARIES